ncbi:biotin transporter BioY [Alkalicoccus halolimnae]|uniref:Biotin transporter n=1 Tax=Alkalicoccus halolimnae TaxID=1667239 RepID=A0AAJ8LW57_9BACI|nr:biotin transporter BioY [Alkalicoccus halolimnae]
MTATKPKVQTVHITYAAMFIALMAIGANLTAFITLGGVPLTFQTVVAVLAGIILGKKLGTLAIAGYILLGLTGVPIFAGFSGGVSVLASPTFGFLVSFLFIAFSSGFVMELMKTKTKSGFFIAGLTGLLFNYGIGVPYLYFYTVTILGVTDTSFLLIAGGMSAFFIKDLILVFFTAALAAQLYSRRAIRPVWQQAA